MFLNILSAKPNLRATDNRVVVVFDFETGSTDLLAPLQRAVRAVADPSISKLVHAGKKVRTVLRSESTDHAVG